MDEYYNEMAQGYDELHGEEQLKKLKIIKKELDIEKTERLLDVGCGSGISSQFDCEVVGTDPSKDLLAIAKRKYPNKTFLQANAENLPFNTHSFDLVISLTAIQNFSGIRSGLKEIKRVGKKKFALSYLKKSAKSSAISNAIKEIFAEFKITKIEEEKDIIFIIRE